MVQLSEGVEVIPLSRIRVDQRLQMRADPVGARAEEIEDAVEAIRLRYTGEIPSDGRVVPPPEVVIDADANAWLTDGFKRYEAAVRAGLAELPCRTRRGTFADALWAACGANRDNSVGRNRADVQKALRAALELRPELSDEAIAAAVGVVRTTVLNMRNRMVEELARRSLERGEAPDPRRVAPTTRVDASGREHDISRMRGGKEQARRKRADDATDSGGEPMVTDALGVPVPEAVRDVFAAQGLREQAEAVGAWAKSYDPAAVLRELHRRAPYNPWLAEAMPQVEAILRQARDGFAAARDMVLRALPHVPCPRCDGEGCDGDDGCRNAGWLPKYRWQELYEGGD